MAFYTDTGNMNAAQGWLIDAIVTGLRRARLARYGVDQSHFDDVFRAVPIESRSLVSRDEKTGAVRAGRKSSGAESAVPIILMILMVMMTMLGAASMLGVVAEDKLQRVFEMLLASVTPFELMAGKVLASVGVSLTSSIFYILGGLLVMQAMALFGMARLELLPWFFVYIICQVTMLSAMGAALGSACSTPARCATTHAARDPADHGADHSDRAADTGAERCFHHRVFVLSAVHAGGDADAPGDAGRSALVAALAWISGSGGVGDGADLGGGADFSRGSPVTGEDAEGGELLRWAVRG